MPSLAENTDQLDVWVRYVIWARESFTMPVSVIHGLNFPFYDASITRGPLPFFAFIFKGVARINKVFYDFYYFPFVELVLVFLSAYFTCLLLDSLRTREFGLKLLAAVLTALSFVLLYRSSNYYGVTYFVIYVPLYLGFAYFYKRLFDRPDRISAAVLVVLMATATMMFEHYVLFGMYFLFLVCAVSCGANYMWNRSDMNLLRAKYTTIALVSSVVVTMAVVYALGKQGDININIAKMAPPLLIGRFDSAWGYGGGFGGGFHVADLLAFIVPPQYDPNVKDYFWCGPSAILTRLGFPLTTNSLQAGQYEGFSYLGTACIAMLATITVLGIIFIVRRNGRVFERFIFRRGSSLVTRNELIGYSGMMFIGSAILFTLSWGYILHIAGIRFDGVVTPSFLIATVWPKFLFVRSMGRLAVPLALFVIIGTVVAFGTTIRVFTARRSIPVRVMTGLVVVILIGLHIYEIHGYLEPPKTVVKGNYLDSIYGSEDAAAIRNATAGRRAVIAIPAIRSSDNWLILCYSLAYYSNAPINGYYSGLGVNPVHITASRVDTDEVMSGKIKHLLERYGNVIVAAPPDAAAHIRRVTDTPLSVRQLENGGMVLLTPWGI